VNNTTGSEPFAGLQLSGVLKYEEKIELTVSNCSREFKSAPCFRSPFLERRSSTSAFVIFLDKPRSVEEQESVIGDGHSIVQGPKMGGITRASERREYGSRL
jgi:hypothetical protein